MKAVDGVKKSPGFCRNPSKESRALVSLFKVDALKKRLCVTEWMLPSHVFVGENVGCSSDEEKKPTLVAVRRLLFSIGFSINTLTCKC